MGSTASEFQALKTLLLSQLDAYEASLAAANLPEPHATKPELHPTDDPQFLPSHELTKSQNLLVASLHMMANVVRSPAERIMSESMTHHVSAALNYVTEAKIADALLPAGERGLSAENLGAQLNLHPVHLAHVMRLLANDQIFAEVSENVFANNRASLLLVEQSPITSFVRWQTWFSYNVCTKISETWRKDPALIGDWHPHSTAAAERFFKGTKHEDFWQWAAAEEPDKIKMFALSMNAIGSVGLAGLLADYPWAKLPKEGLIVDVGGGAGNMLLPILEAHETMHGIVQDRMEVIPEAKANFEKRLPAAMADKRVEFDGVDFVNPQQRTGADVYLFRWICHDLPDYRIIPVLKQQVKVMRPDSKLIIIDAIISPATQAREAKGDLAPYPLPQSMGYAGEFLLRIDNEMVADLNATERTLQQFEKMLAQAGLKIIGVYRPRAPHCIIETMLA